MNRSLFGKLFTVTVIILCLGIAVLIAVLSFMSSSARKNERFNVIENNAAAVADSYRHISSTKNYAEIDRMASTVADAYNSTVFFVDKDGLTYICSDLSEHKNCVHITSAVSDSIMKQVMGKGIYRDIGTFGGKYIKEYYTVGVPVVNNFGETEGAVFVSCAADSVESLTPRIVLISVLIGLVIISVLTVVVYFFTKNMFKPIGEMTDAVRVMASGDFSHRVITHGNDEINELARCFNEMSASLESLEEMRSSFVSNISHEFRTPMTTIGGFIDGILNGTIPKEKQNHYLTIVSSEIRRLSSLVNAMLSLSKLDSGQTKLECHKTDITDTACRVILSFERELTIKNIQIIGMEDAPQIFAECDGQLIYQAIYNLFDNAVKFTPNDGYISIFIQEYNSQVRLYIKNSGDGIPEEDLARIFERFYKTDKSRSVDKTGVGLGLNIVKSIIDHHNGDIQVKSIEGQYTQFTMILPKIHNNGDNNENRTNVS